MQIAVAVSGGVDSLCALALLRAAGHDVLALHGLFLPGRSAPAGQRDPLPGLEAACAILNIPLHIIDLRATFHSQVIAPFARAYAAGRTPNPCALCNRAVKFGALLDAAIALGAEKLATGHYARLGPALPGSRAPVSLAAARDAAKDQSYFLSLAPADRLQHALFPLAGRTKAQSAALVAQAGLEVPLPGESQDICFVPGQKPGRKQASGVLSGSAPASGEYADFLAAQWRARGITPPGSGPILLADGAGGLREIARHRGLWRYTEGQRKGLGIAHSEPLYVLGKDKRHNALVVGPRALLGMTACVAEELNVLVEPELWPGRVLARLRYRQRPVPACARLRGGRLHIVLDSPCFPSAPGQVAAVYDADGRVLAGGIVQEIDTSISG
ncbi:tRNA methyl transferase PRC-barrel domain-containing protein [Desulfovibrio sp. ZJ200]|uniref:tRNA-specific 2-thiouridylase n=1 Tax=Desulfovibrio sp. ZJ200 TaxID=2709792 RepID=UPI0013EE06FB|nr:tRNA methyl transferase PRC-barrel domain-containing protein [Desulfovibrio sp. ZJ200]